MCDKCPSRGARPDETSQHVRYVSAAEDASRLGRSGSGPTIVKAANWSPISSTSGRARCGGTGSSSSPAAPGSCVTTSGVRDERMARPELSLDLWAADLHAVIEAARPDGPVTLLGISQGAATCIRYAHPAAGTGRQADPVRGLRARCDAPRVAGRAGVSSGHDRSGASRRGDGTIPTFRQLFTSRFIPGGTPEQLQWFNDLCLKTTTGEVVASLFEARAQIDVTAELGDVRAPTLVLHARDDEVIPVDGRTPARERHSRRRVRRAGLAEPHPAGARAGVAAVSRGHRLIHGA